MRPRDTTPEADRIQIEIYRRMGAEARLRAELDLSALSRRLLEQGIGARHPELEPTSWIDFSGS